MAHKTFVTVMKTDNMRYYDGKFRNQLIAWDGEGRAYTLKPVHSTRETIDHASSTAFPRKSVKSVEWVREEELDHPEGS